MANADSIILEYAQYGYWANERICTLIEAHPEVIDTEVASSFITVRHTVYHIWDAETLWLKRVQGISLDYYPSKHYATNGLAFLDLWLGVSGGLINFIKENSPGIAELDIEYKTTSGKTFSQPAWQMLMQVFNHGSYHRGQIITMMRELGVSENLPQTDLIRFFRDKAKGLIDV